MSRENYVPVPKDLSEIKNKLVFGLTRRQLAGFGASAVLGLPVYYLMFSLSGDVSMGLIGLFIVGAPIMLVVNMKRGGLPSEEWFKNWLYFKVLSQPFVLFKKPNIKPNAVKKRSLKIKKKLAEEKKEEKTQREQSGNYFVISKQEKVTILTVLKMVIKKIIKKIKGEKIKKVVSQDFLNYKDIYKNGICRISKNVFSKTICFEDINYQLVKKEEQQRIFYEYCGLLNSFSEGVKIQLTFVNELVGFDNPMSAFFIESQDDKFNDIRKEYQEMLRLQIEKGNNGLIRRKYMTFIIEARGIYEARQQLNRIETDSINILKSMGVSSFPISGTEKLKILNKILNGSESNLKFSWKKKNRLALSTQDFIAPKKMSFKDKRFCRLSKRYVQTQYLSILASDISDRLLANFLDVEAELLINIHIEPIEQQRAIKDVKRKSTDVDRMKIEEQRKALRAGYDMDVLPPDLITFSEEAKDVLNLLQNENEKLFDVTFLITNIAKTKVRLDNEVLQVRSIALMANCDLLPYDYNQEGCLISALPLGINKTFPRRPLTTQSLAAFMPFTTQEINMPGKSLYYGLNALSNNIIMADRKRLANPNGLILGVPGSGKSFAAKREITNVFLITNDIIMICDPEGEYYWLVELLGGQVIDISQNSKHFINPFDINEDYADDGDPVDFKSDFVISMMELICGGKTGLSAVEISLIDRCTRKIYEPYILDPCPENIPIMEDLYNSLRSIEGSDEARWLAEALHIYVHGSLRMFNNRTNVNVKNRLVCYNIKNLTKSVKKLGMLIIQDQVWNTVTVNRGKGISTWYYIDEFHLLLKDQQTAEYSVEIWKRFRKWGGVPTGITQNIKDLLISMEIENIFENSDFVLLLRQAPGDREILAEKLHISRQQLGHVDNSEPGYGLIKYGGIMLPFKDEFPQDTKLYKVMTTKPNEAIAIK